MTVFRSMGLQASLCVQFKLLVKAAQGFLFPDHELRVSSWLHLRNPMKIKHGSCLPGAPRLPEGFMPVSGSSGEAQLVPMVRKKTWSVLLGWGQEGLSRGKA